LDYDALISLIESYGYAALFFALWLGIVGMPIPDEVIVMTGGAVTASGTLHVLPAFLLTYVGVISGLSLGYMLGRFVGTPILEKLRRKNGMNHYIAVSEKLTQKYGSLALCIGYFLPVVRHVMPYLVGINKMSYKRYALYSYTTGFVWTLFYFTTGRFVGNHIQEAAALAYSYGIKLLWLCFVLLAAIIIRRLAYRHQIASEELL